MQMNIHKQQQQQQQGQQQAQPAIQTSSALVSGIITQHQTLPVVQHDGTQTVALHSLQPTQQQQQTNLIVVSKTPQGVVAADNSNVGAGVSQQMLQQLRLQSSQIIQQHPQLQQQQQNVTPAGIRAISSVQNSTSQYNLGQPQQQMIIIRQPQPVIVVSAAGTSAANTTLQGQPQMLTLQQNSIRPLSATALNRTVLPAGMNQMPRQPAAGTAHFLTTARQQHPLNVTLSAGAILTAQASSSATSDQTVMLTPQQQQQQQHAGVSSISGFGLNLDLAGLNSAGQLVKSDGDMTPLTPQDQLSRYVDQL